MKILFTLDSSDGIDPKDPIGDITITDEQTLLSIESTYLDSWFETLIDGFKSLKINQKITLEIMEEPESITFEPISQGFKISYRKRVLFLSNLNEFLQPLLLSAQEFLALLDQNEIKPENLLNLLSIRQFIEDYTHQQEPQLTRTVLV